jgi:hypothetical protein
MRVPRNESNASWEIKQKAIKPEAAKLHPSLAATPKHWVAGKNGYEDYMIRVAKRGYYEDSNSGRPAGSRVEFDEKLQKYVVTM